MTDRIDLKEFLTAYLAEADDHLAAANAKALAVEAAVADGRNDPRAMRDLFRIVHTVKGLSAMVGVEPIVAIAHRLESLLRVADRSGVALAPAALETVFEALRAVEQRVRALEQGKEPPAPPAELMARLEDHPSGVVPGSSRPLGEALDLDPEVLAKLAGFERDQLVRGGAEGRRVLRAVFTPSPKKAAEGLTINSVRARLGSIAEIVKVLPTSVAPSESAPGGLSFLFFLLTSAEDVEIAAAAGCEASDVHPLLRPPADAPDVDELAAGLPVDTEGEGLVGPMHEGEAPALPARSVLRVDVSRVDDAMERLSALIVTRSRLARAVGALEGEAQAVRELRAIVQESARQLRDLRGSILRIRMVPFAEVLSRLPLILRGIRRTTGKEVRLETQVADAELDKAVAERVFPALVHLVRNAVDHGLGTREERIRQGKRPEGVVRVVCSARSNRHVAIQVSDDGRGIDRAAVARAAGAEVPTSDASLLELLCRPGLSTRAEATTTSGRGMGMDIVRKIVVSELGGELSMQTRDEEGTTFTLLIPLTVSIVDAFTVECDKERFAVPVAVVEEILELEPKRIVRGPGGFEDGVVGLLERRGEMLLVVDLGSVLEARKQARPRRQALVVRRAGEIVAFGIDRVLTQQETVVRPLVDPLVQGTRIAGSTDLGDGRPTLVLDLVAVLGSLGGGGGTGDRRELLALLEKGGRAA